MITINWEIKRFVGKKRQLPEIRIPLGKEWDKKMETSEKLMELGNGKLMGRGIFVFEEDRV